MQQEVESLATHVHVQTLSMCLLSAKSCKNDINDSKNIAEMRNNKMRFDVQGIRATMHAMGTRQIFNPLLPVQSRVLPVHDNMERTKLILEVGNLS